MAKFNPKDLIAKLKEGVKAAPKSAPKVVETKSPSGYPIRDMRKEAMDMGAHGTKEMFGENQV